MSAAVERSTPTITFAIPYFRNVGYLLEAIASVRAQTFDDWEVVVVDDAGPEPAHDEVARIGDARIRYARNPENLGLALNWNECLRQARAPLVTLLHADDRVLPDYATRVVEAAAQNADVAAFFTDADVIGPTGTKKRSLTDSVKRFARRPDEDHPVAGDDDLAAILANNYVMCPTLCYRIARVGVSPFDDRWQMVLDLDNMSRLLLAGEQLFGIRRSLYEYRRHPMNVTSSRTADATRFAEELAIYRELATTTEAAGWTRSARVARHRWMVRSHLALRALVDTGTGRFANGRDKARMLYADLRR